jgi:hypothetical protein
MTQGRRFNGWDLNMLATVNHTSPVPREPAGDLCDFHDDLSSPQVTNARIAAKVRSRRNWT